MLKTLIVMLLAVTAGTIGDILLAKGKIGRASCRERV